MKIRGITAALGITALGFLAAGCAGVAVEPSVGQYALVTGHGALSSQNLNAVYGPGERRSAGNGSVVWYVPANVRDYITAQPGNEADRTNPQAVNTGSGDGSNGTPVYTYSFVGWELNPAIDIGNGHVSPIADAFFKFCLKFGCATTTAQNDASNSGLSHSSVPGWNTMLSEIFPTAIDNASQAAASKFPPALWSSDRSQWPAYGNAISADLLNEFRKLTGSNFDYFCGPGSTTTHCTAPVVQVKNVVPQDPGAQAAYNQQVQASIQGQAASTRLSTATKLYGPYAHWYLTQIDLMNACNGKSDCNVYLGNPPAVLGGK